MGDFKNSKKFWQFYSSSVKLRSDHDDDNQIVINHDGIIVDSPAVVGDVFNTFFTSLNSRSLSTAESSEKFVDNQFKELKVAKLVNAPMNTFVFHSTTSIIVGKILAKLCPSSSAGVSGIPSKVLKSCHETIVPILTLLINDCLSSNTIPVDWKTAVVTPLYKSKGDKSDLNNYRGISILPPVAKILEKIMASQIIIYLNFNNILFSGQHGFRSSHSCESALHELISDLNINRDKKLISLLLFIDFQKAFDLVDTKLLLRKLFHYGFSDSANEMVSNYFMNRQQLVKINSVCSSFKPIKLGVPQGSVLGPLFFIIFINDLPFLLNQFKSKLFADDTTLLDSDKELDVLITKFVNKLKLLLEWCEFNKLDLNLSKTFFMFISSKRCKKLKLPSAINVQGIDIKVVDNFKLLGVIIDNKLNFLQYACQLKKMINKKMYSIKRLFYLSTAVKLQFFKTFILPYFDYCLSLIIYFPKVVIQKMSNCFNITIYKLLKIKSNGYITLDSDFNKLNVLLSKFGLFNFTHRVITKIFQFVFSLKTESDGPKLLQQQLLTNKVANPGRRVLRSDNKIKQAYVENNNYGELTFGYFFPRLINQFKNSFDLSLKDFIKKLYLELDFIFINFIKSFSQFSLFYKFY
jgi:hypothetical protein